MPATTHCIDAPSPDADSAAADAQDCIFIGADSFTGAGQLRYYQVTASNGGVDGISSIVAGEVAGDCNADFKIELNGVATITADMLLA